MRVAVVAPSLLTVANMGCGFYALLAVHRGEFVSAATAILLGMVFDALDGRVARLVHGESMFGVEFDSLCDFLTFGVAPGHMMYAFILKDYGVWGFPIAFLYAMCGGLRLARFNAVAHETGGSKTHFTGLPIPGGAGVLASFVLLYQIIEEGRPARTWQLLMDQIPLLYSAAPLFVLAVGFLMVSTIPYPAFKQSNALQPKKISALIAGTVFGFLLFFYPTNVIFLVFTGYALLGPVGWLVNAARRLAGRPLPKDEQLAPNTDLEAHH